MGQVIGFEERSIAQLRERLGAAEEARLDLLAYARGHSGVVASIHAAVIAIMHCDRFDDLLHVVTKQWPAALGLDSVALALTVQGQGFRADCNGVEKVDPKMLMHGFANLHDVTMRNVGRGHPVFGPAGESIRSEALIRIDGDPRLPSGVLALGQRSDQSFDTRHGSELLMFLGDALAAMIRRCLIDPTA